jgi:hypothetical protein
MTTVSREGRDLATVDSEASQLLARIGRQVLQALGEPSGLRAINVKRLWDDHYRVNVLIGRDATSATIAHSYFLKADGTGHVVTAIPEIMRRY